MTRRSDGDAAARRLLGDVPGVEIVAGQFGDIWLRDTGPIFGFDPEGPQSHAFGFNGWGGMYELEHDGEVAIQIAEAAQTALISHDFILEGGALDCDGGGAALTTAQCL